jgi:hypothetical protein
MLSERFRRGRAIRPFNGSFAYSTVAGLPMPECFPDIPIRFSRDPINMSGYESVYVPMTVNGDSRTFPTITGNGRNALHEQTFPASSVALT